MRDLDALLDEPDVAIAVVGATDDPTKYGSRIYRDLKAKGYRVWPVNPNRTTVDGDPAFPSVRDLPIGPDDIVILNLVVPPDVGRRVVEEALSSGIGETGRVNVWLQPGAESPELLAFLRAQGVDHLADACIMVRTRLRRPRSPAG